MPASVADSSSEPMALNTPLTWPGRTALCGQLDESTVGRRLAICGWVDRSRNMGAMQFFDVRDHTGLLQVWGAYHSTAQQALSTTNHYTRHHTRQRTGGALSGPMSHA